MGGAVEPNRHMSLNADQLEWSLLQQRAALSEITDEEQRSRRSEAINSVGNYVGLLRAAESLPTNFSFKLELNDGRWDIAEKHLTAPPRVGDVLSLAGQRWRVRASQLVRPRPSGRPAREVFVCAPVV
jgi:hypothetical protein